MIPKTIHYCWFGAGKPPDVMIRCIDSWSEVMPDYSIKRWDESNFDVDGFPYAREAHKQKKWAFVSDVARLHALVSEGGIYLDTDVAVYRPFDRFLKHQLFLGMMLPDSVGTAVIGAAAGNAHLRELLAGYEGAKVDLFPNNDLFTGYLISAFGAEFFLSDRYQELGDGTAIYPRRCFERPTRSHRWGYSEHMSYGSWNGSHGRKPWHLQAIGALAGPVGQARFAEFVSMPRARYWRRYVEDALRYPRETMAGWLSRRGQEGEGI